MEGVQQSPGSGIQIIAASWRDLSDLHHLEKICFEKDVWPFLDLLGVLTFPGIIRLKAIHDSKMVGFIAADIRQRKQTAWIATLAVLPAYRRTGIATALLESCEARIILPTIRLSVRRSNTAAIHLYQKHGYHQVKTWPRYYKGDEDALIFEKACSNNKK